MVERRVWKSIKAAGISPPWMLQCFITQCILLLTAHLFFFPPVSVIYTRDGCVRAARCLAIRMAAATFPTTPPFAQHPLPPSFKLSQLDVWSDTNRRVIRACAGSLWKVFETARGVLREIAQN
jgi:hypothetical protein